MIRNFGVIQKFCERRRKCAATFLESCLYFLTNIFVDTLVKHGGFKVVGCLEIDPDWEIQIGGECL